MIHGLSQKYWRPKIIFAIASTIWTPICINFAYNKTTFDRTFSCYGRVLVNLDLVKEFNYKILVEMIGFDFFWRLNMIKFHNFAIVVHVLGTHMLTA